MRPNKWQLHESVKEQKEKGYENNNYGSITGSIEFLPHQTK
jgi:hypothetical protein